MNRDLHRVVAVVFLAVTIALAAGCHSKPKVAPTIAGQIADAQPLDEWRRHDALTGVMFVTLGDRGQVEAKFTYDIQNHKFRLELPDDNKTLIVFDGKQAWVSPADSPLKETRANFLAWAQIMTVPFRLKAPNTQAVDLPNQKLGAKECLAVKLTLGPGGVGTPNDWYILFADPETKRIEGMAFSQGYGKPADEAESDLRAVTFYDFRPTSDIRMGTEWKFWQYHKDEGIFGRPIGSARLLNLEFVENPKPGLFTRPANARPDEK